MLTMFAFINDPHIKMGWDDQKAIIEKCQEIAPSAFVDKIPPFKTRKVDISDGPTRLRYAKGVNEYMYAGEQFYRNVFAKPIREALKDNTKVWLELCDVDTLMCRAKFREQNDRSAKLKQAEKKRKEKKDKIPLPKYDPESTFCESGLRSPDGNSVQMFNIQSISGNKALRNKLLTFCGEMLMMDPIIPLGCSVIMQHLPIGPGKFVKLPEAEANAYFLLNTHKHPFGEADMQIAFWAFIYGSTRPQSEEEETGDRPSNIEVHTTDSDLLGILCNVVAKLNAEETKEKRTQIYWNRGRIIKHDGKDHGNHKLIHINSLVYHLEKREWSIPKFLTIGHIFGSDFAWKSDLCPGVTFTGAWTTLIANMKDLDAIYVPAASLVKRKCFAVWEHVLWNPNELSLEYMPHFFKGTETHPRPREGKDASYEVSTKALNN